MRYRRLGPVAGGVVVLGAAAAWLFGTREPGSRTDELAAAPAKPGPDPFGFSAAFDAEVAKVGQITPRQLAARYPAPADLEKFSWDPTTAKFFDKLNVEKVVKPAATVKDDYGRSQVVPAVELRGYKLAPDELAAYKRNGFVVSERLGGYSFGQVYYDVYSRDLPVFITSDSVLHAWHRSYDAMLEELEKTYQTQRPRRPDDSCQVADGVQHTLGQGSPHQESVGTVCRLLRPYQAGPEEGRVLVDVRTH